MRTQLFAFLLASAVAVTPSFAQTKGKAAAVKSTAHPQIRRIVANLDSVSVTMKVLTRELSRKPLKFFSGVPEAAEPISPVKKP